MFSFNIKYFLFLTPTLPGRFKENNYSVGKVTFGFNKIKARFGYIFEGEKTLHLQQKRSDPPNTTCEKIIILTCCMLPVCMGPCVSFVVGIELID